MNKSESIVKLSTALLKFHGAMGKVGKDSVNPHFKNKYASLSNIIEAVTPHLNASGLTVLQMPSVEGLETVLLHESGEYISSLSAIAAPMNANAQQVGSAITYARRYALGAVLSLNIDEDDDANAASVAPAGRVKPASDVAPLAAIKSAKSLGELQAVWKSLTQAEQKLATVTAAKDAKKNELTPQ